MRAQLQVVWCVLRLARVVDDDAARPRRRRRRRRRRRQSDAPAFCALAPVCGASTSCCDKSMPISSSTLLITCGARVGAAQRAVARARSRRRPRPVLPLRPPRPSTRRSFHPSPGRARDRCARANSTPRSAAADDGDSANNTARAARTSCFMSMNSLCFSNSIITRCRRIARVTQRQQEKQRTRPTREHAPALLAN